MKKSFTTANLHRRKHKQKGKRKQHNCNLLRVYLTETVSIRRQIVLGSKLIVSRFGIGKFPCIARIFILLGVQANE